MSNVAENTPPTNTRRWLHRLGALVGLHLVPLVVSAAAFSLYAGHTGGGFDAVRSVMLACSTVFAWQLLGLLRDISSSRSVAPWLAWLATVFFLPVMGLTATSDPEIPAALALTIAARCLVRAHGSRSLAWFGATVAAFTPWLHLRFTLLAVVMVGCIAFTAVGRSDLPQRGRRIANVTVRALPFSGLLIVSVGVLLGVSAYLNDSPSPFAAGTITDAFAAWSAADIYRMGIGSLVGLTQGLFTVAPVMILAVAAMPLVIRRFGWIGAALATAALAQAVLVNSLASFGGQLPGHHLVVLLPLLAVALTLALQKGRVVIGLAMGLLATGAVPLVQSYTAFGEFLDNSTPQTSLQLATESMWVDVDAAIMDSLPLVALWAALVAMSALWLSGQRTRSARHFKRPEPDAVTIPEPTIDLTAEDDAPTRPILHRRPS